MCTSMPIDLERVKIVFDPKDNDFMIAYGQDVPGAGFMVEVKRPLKEEEKVIIRGYVKMAKIKGINDDEV